MRKDSSLSAHDLRAPTPLVQHTDIPVPVHKLCEHRVGCKAWKCRCRSCLQPSGHQPHDCPGPGPSLSSQLGSCLHRSAPGGAILAEGALAHDHQAGAQSPALRSALLWSHILLQPLTLTLGLCNVLLPHAHGILLQTPSLPHHRGLLLVPALFVPSRAQAAQGQEHWVLLAGPWTWQMPLQA